MKAYKNRIIFIPKKNTSVMHGPEADMDSYQATPILEPKHCELVTEQICTPSDFVTPPEEKRSVMKEQVNQEGSHSKGDTMVESLLHDDFIDQLISVKNTIFPSGSDSVIPEFIAESNNVTPTSIQPKKLSFEDTLKQFMATPEPKATSNTERSQPAIVSPTPNNSIQKVSRGIKKVRRGV